MERFFKHKLGFTLAEIMIVLTVIGILTAILLPAAIHSTPNENVMKFKKAHNTLYKVINELVNNDKYYGDDLSLKPDGTDISSATYLCETIADVLSTKNVACSQYNGDYWDGVLILSADSSNLQELKGKLDTRCKNKTAAGAEITTTDNAVFYQVNPNQHFASHSKTNGDDNLETDEKLFLLRSPEGINADKTFLRIYKVFCVDVDGIGKGEDPFGYGIRADGKILTGARADEWLAKSIQEK